MRIMPPQKVTAPDLLQEASAGASCFLHKENHRLRPKSFSDAKKKYSSKARDKSRKAAHACMVWDCNIKVDVVR